MGAWMTARLAGKTALITGAATGIGRATALTFAQNGARVVLFGLGDAELEMAATEAGGHAVAGDVTKSADIVRAIERCGQRLDIVVNAAGLIIPDQPLDVSDDVWARTLDVNLTGTMRVCRAALPLLKQQAGVIVNVASVAAFNASPDSTSYAASKAAVVAYTRSLAFAHGADSIRANAVAPGWVRTPMSAYEMQLLAEQNDTTADAEFRSVERRIALGRMAAPAEIAACCLFLASDEASFVTGAVLVVDGGGRSPTHSRAI